MSHIAVLLWHSSNLVICQPDVCPLWKADFAPPIGLGDHSFGVSHDIVVRRIVHRCVDDTHPLKFPELLEAWHGFGLLDRRSPHDHPGATNNRGA